MDEIITPRSLAERVAAFGVAGAHDDIAVPPQFWPGFVSVLSSENLTGCANAAIRSGHLVSTDEQREKFDDVHLEATIRTLALERSLLRLQVAMGDEGIGSVVLKGPALAYRFYPDPSWRAFTDVDVMVRAMDWRRACELLERLGFHRELPEPRPGFDERFGKAALHVDKDGLGVDLHRTLVLGPFGVWLDSEELFERAVPFVVAGRTMQRFDDTTTLLHACMHASLGWMPPLLLPVRDVAQVVNRGEIDWERFRRDVIRWKLGAVVAHAFRTVRDVLRVPLPGQTQEFFDAKTTRRERRALAAYVTSRRGRGGTERSQLWAVPGMRSKAALARDLLFPNEAFLAARAEDGKRPSYVRRWATPVRWVFRRPR